MKVTLTISGMNCGHCVKAVTEALSALAGVQDLHVEVGSAAFQAASAPDRDELARVIDDAGFELGDVSTSP